ncbi:MAG: S9 family peptidase [Bacteroidales bacterium]|nr:S9 family peptidase [Bacteroidales bacterium]
MENKFIRSRSLIRTGSMMMILLTCTFIWGHTQNADADDKIEVVVNEWLKLGSFDVKMPVYSDQKNVKGETFEDEDLLKYNFVDISTLQPIDKKQFSWKNNSFSWEKTTSAKNGFVYLEKKVTGSKHQLGFLATYLYVDRFLEVVIEISSPQMFEFYLNGELQNTKSTADTPDADKTGNTKKTIKLERGKHLLLIKTLKPSDNDTDWTVKAQVTFSEKFGKDVVRAEISPKTIKNINHLLEGDFVNSVSVSPDGSMVLLRFSSVTPPDGKTERWAEIRELNTNVLLHSFRHSDMSGIEWIPGGEGISYSTVKDGKSSIWLFNLIDLSQSVLIEDLKDLGGYSWSPDGSFIIYSISEKPEEEKSGLKRLEGMPDRWPWWRNRSYLNKLDVASGISEKLTHGHLTTSLMDIKPDGTKVLFSMNIPDYSERPYSKQFLMEMDLETFEVDTLWENNVSASCQYSPNGQYLLVKASATMFGDIGMNVSGDVIPNESDTQAYIYNLATGNTDPITFEFNPSISDAFWSYFDENKIYFVVTDRTYRNIYVYDMNTRYFEKINTGLDVVNSFSMAKMAPVAVYTGSGNSAPPDARKIDLTTGQFEVIAYSQVKQFEHVVFGKTEDWNFTNDAGVEIEGRVYYPPDFDKSKQYPLIVFYYAGTTPTDRSFGGRYPKNMFAAQGYVVYTLQPSGAIGYGQDFSAAHVNNWGITVADEIIKGTKLFLKDHKFIDTSRVGCIGASYGGFMTMLLQTRTDIFAAAISHAGISSISSYWGEGYWGYLYSASATANSFPWNNQELYVGQSPLFSADKINTPLLLLHGADDTNVPVGESLQLYTALKLLGKQVEMIEVAGQDHHILDYKKRIIWQKTIFAWFDKWLKDQPEWWNELYPDRNL